MHELALKLKTLRLGDIAVRRNPLFYAWARRQLAAPDEAQLGRILWWASRRTAYGRRVNGADHLASWPLLEKESVRNAPGDFLAGPQFLAAKASTGGTSGSPLPLARSLRSVVLEQAAIDHMIEALGARPGEARIAVLRGDNVKDPSDFRPPYWKFVAGGRRMILSSNHLNAATIGAYAEAIERFSPDILWAYPTSLESLCVQLERAAVRLQVARVLTSSEVLHPGAWRLAERTLGCRLVDYYGQAERVGFAWAKAPGEYRFLPGYAEVELLESGADGLYKLYEIVGTSLWNHAMPLVRYRTGDLVRLPASWNERQVKEVAEGSRPFGGVLGRDSDILISPEGVRLTGIDHFQREVKHLRRIQVIQESATEVRVLVLGTPEFEDADAAQLEANIRKKLPGSMRVDLERVEALERTGLGKTPFVIHRTAVKKLLRTATATAS
jgi:phenylacetate-CoA ligase